MSNITIKQYRNSTIFGLILAFSAFFLFLSVLLLSILMLFFSHWQFHSDIAKPECSSQSYLLYLQKVSIFQIIYITFLTILGTLIICLAIGLCIAYSRKHLIYNSRQLNLYRLIILILMVALVAGLCSLLHIVRIFQQIEELQKNYHKKEQFFILTNCFTSQSYDTLISKKQLFITLIILLSLVVLLLLIAFVIMYWVLWKLRRFNNSYEESKEENKVHHDFSLQVNNESFSHLVVNSSENKEKQEKQGGQQKVLETPRNKNICKIDRTELSGFHRQHPQLMHSSKQKNSRAESYQQEQGEMSLRQFTKESERSKWKVRRSRIFDAIGIATYLPESRTKQ